MNLSSEIQRITNTKETKYLRWYESLIKSRLPRKKKRGDYLERHHIFPKCLFGNNTILVNLTFREHYLAHLLLAMHISKTLGRSEILFKLVHPLHRMKGIKKNQFSNVSCRPFSRSYETARKIYMDNVTGRPKSKETIERMRNKPPMSDATKRKLSEANLGPKNPMYGRNFTDEHRKNLSISNTGRKMSPDFCRKLSLTRTGALHPLHGKSPSEESRMKMSKSHTKTYEIVDVNDVVMHITSLNEFCEINSINRSALTTYSKNGKFYKGFKILTSIKSSPELSE